MNEETHTRKHLRHARATPLASTLTILSFASWAFAFYYFLQVSGRNMRQREDMAEGSDWHLGCGARFHHAFCGSGGLRRIL